MAVSRLALAAVVTALAFGSGAMAQSGTGSKTPAEFPPASYKANQYVDSRGCVFIRAGVDGNVTWVPRMTRQRQQVCGMAPTQVAGSAVAPARTRSVEEITLDAPAAQTAAAPAPVAKPKPVKPAAVEVVKTTPKPRPAPAKVVRKAATKPVVIKPARVAAPAPAPVVVSAPKPVEVVAAPVVTPQRGQPACKGASPISSQYINSGQFAPVRCGPQPRTTASVSTGSVVQAVRPGAPVDAATLPRSTRVVPLHVARQRAGVGSFQVPEGYRAAWDDDRLNPRRAEGTLGGRDAMNLFWTTTVPRRLIDRSSGRDVTAKVALVYPFTDREVQQRVLGDVTIITRNGQTMKRVLRNPGAPSARSLAAAPGTVAKKPVYSTRSAPVEAAKPAVRAKPKAAAKAKPKGETISGKRYVQVGTFGVPQNAQNTAARLKRLGLPMRIGKYSRGGKTYRMVLAGPFGDTASATKALRTVRGAGFGDAFLRK